MGAAWWGDVGAYLVTGSGLQWGKKPEKEPTFAYVCMSYKVFACRMFHVDDGHFEYSTSLN